MRLFLISITCLLSNCEQKNVEADVAKKPAVEQEATSPQEAAPVTTNTFLIRYDHGIGKDAISATASNLDGIFKQTITRNGTEKTIDLTEDKFNSLWDGIIDIKDISEHTVTDLDAELNTKNNHIVGIVYLTGKQKGMRTFSIPIENRSDKFNQWLSKITKQ